MPTSFRSGRFVRQGQRTSSNVPSSEYIFAVMVSAYETVPARLAELELVIWIAPVFEPTPVNTSML